MQRKRTNGFHFSVFVCFLVATTAAANVLSAGLVGKLPANFSVSNTGAAQYSIPIEVPPGGGGLTPSLSFEYNHAGGSGIAGQGWTIGGLSQISRCPQTLAQDGQVGAVRFDADDRFCLDGQRLMVTTGTYGASGAEYRTEIESFRRIESFYQSGSGPSHFIVTDRNGTKFYYGKNGNSAIVDGATNSIVRWSLDRVQDRFDNQIDLYYVTVQATGQQWLGEVSYSKKDATGQLARHVISFEYEDRPVSDQREGYRFGAIWSSVKRLKKVTVRARDGSDVFQEHSHYDLTYQTGVSGRSQLIEIERCRLGDCLSATTFDWQDAALGWGAESSTGQSSSGHGYPLPADFDGDGQVDLYVTKNARWHVLQASNDSFAAPMDTTRSASFASCAKTLDLDGDRRTDILVKATDGKWHVYQALDGTGASSFTDINTNIAAGDCDLVYVQDVDGDGRDDLLVASGTSIYLYKSVGTTFASTYSVVLSGSQQISELRGLGDEKMHGRVDFDGDQRGDLLVKTVIFTGPPWEPIEIENWDAYVFDGASYDHYYDLGNGYVQRRVADFNGDGLHDVTGYESGNGWTYLTSTGKTFNTSTAPAVSDAYSSRAVFADYNADGQEDLIRATTSGWVVHVSDGDSFATSGVNVGGSSPTSTPILPIDLSGDGNLDFVVNHGSTWKLRKHLSPLPDVVDRFEDGFGNFYAPIYAPLSTTNHYLQYYFGSPPDDQSYQTAMHVVTDYATSDGVGSSYTISMYYYGAKKSLRGRGFLGFRQVRRYDYRDGTRFQRDIFRQSFPYIGRYEWRERRRGDWTWISLNYPGWTHVNLPAGVVFVKQNSQTFYDYELGKTQVGDYYRLTRDTHTYDNTYGNLKKSVVTVTSPQFSGTYITTTDFAYDNYTTPWCVGLPKTVSVTRDTPDAPATTRTVANTFNSSTCRLETSTNTTLAAASDQLKRTYTYDSFGNVRSVSLDAADGSADDRKLETIFDTYGQVVNTEIRHVDGAPDYTTLRTWDPVLAVQKTETDTRGLTTSWQHDSFGRTTQTTVPDGTVETSTLLDCDVPSACSVSAQFAVDISRNDGFDARQYFDAFGRSTTGWQRLPTGTKSWYQIDFDNRARVAREYLPWVQDGATNEPKFYVSFDYDIIDRPTLIDRPISESATSGATTTINYAGLSRTVSVKSNAAETQTTTYASDPAGRTLTITDPGGGITQYRYTAYDELRQTYNMHAPSDTMTLIEYDGIGRKQSMVLPSASTPSCNNNKSVWNTYTVFNEIETENDAKCNLRTYAYNQLGLMTERVEPEGRWDWTYYTTTDHKLWLLNTVTTTATTPTYWESYNYDTLSRLSTSSVDVGGFTYTTEFDYYASGSGRGKLQRITYPTSTSSYRFLVDYEYDGFGLLSKVKRGDGPGTVYYELLEADALGRERLSILGNGFNEDRTYDRATGRLKRIETGPTFYNNKQNLSFEWDYIGKLTRRDDLRQGVYETFDYDILNRVTDAYRNGSTSPSLSLTYDPLGNILTKSDVGTYGYSSSNPYAVTSTTGVRTGSYGYDANGNMSSRNGDTITWTSFDKPSQINAGSDFSQFQYGPDRRRFRNRSKAGSTTTTTHYAGALFERDFIGGLQINRHNIMVGGQTVATHTRESVGSTYERYLHRDHLGSVESISDPVGGMLNRYSFDAFGKRRNSDWTADSSDTLLSTPQAFDRGYTGHEHLDNTKLIHMNGRVQDPILGRMISADLLVPNPALSQDFNRYSYVRNSPLNYTDPSGFQVADNFGNPSRTGIPNYIYTPSDQTIQEQLTQNIRREALGLVYDLPQNNEEFREAFVANVKPFLMRSGRDAVTAGDIAFRTLAIDYKDPFLGDIRAEILLAVTPLKILKLGKLTRYKTFSRGSGGAPNISLEEAEAVARRNGIDTRQFKLEYEDGPHFGFMSQLGDGSVFRAADGRFVITLQNAGLENARAALETIAHELNHIRGVLKTGQPTTEDVAEAAGKAAGKFGR
ncbi:MAG: FG-GAP-like repeat-containing protein [Pseudomonadota bacterium]